ncbi:hypothetical protein BJ165DRAFT_1357993 [Panaeolus papilionaceus]|nr:hypothetical protein BJ165DRAFT_1357993 [Panaeolus papilionaceus]
MSRSEDLPRCLRNTLPTSKSALKQEAKKVLSQQSNDLWVKSPRSLKYEGIEDDFKFSNFHSLANKLNRFQLSQLVRIRTRHYPLNAYLYKRKLAPSDLCNKCNTGAKETLNHFIHDCPAYRRQRRRMHEKIKEAKGDTSKILASEEYTWAMLTYIQETGRFPRTIKNSGQQR